MNVRIIVGLVASSATLALSGAWPATASSVVHATGPRTASATALPRYAFTDLGVLGGLDSLAWTLNGSGQVIGHADTSPGSKNHGFHAFLWTPAVPNGTSGVMTDLGTLPGDGNSTAHGINAAGLIAGESDAADFSSSRAYVDDGTMYDLGGFGGSFSSSNGINASGEITGYSQLPDGYDHAFLWVPGKPGGVKGKMYNLGTLPGQPSSVGEAINDTGTIAGETLDTNFISHAMIWQPGTVNGTSGVMTALPEPPGTQSSGALGINDGGQVVGQLQTADGQLHAYVYDGGVMTDLGTLPGGSFSAAYSINASGLAVGYAETAVRGNDHAVAFTGGRVIDLNSFLPGSAKSAGVVLTTAYGVNDAGQIVGVATIGGHLRGYLLTPLS